MSTISLHDFSLNLNKYIGLIKKGMSFEIFDEPENPFFQIRPAKSNGKRPYGLCKDEFTVPANFNDELPEEILN